MKNNYEEEKVGPLNAQEIILYILSYSLSEDERIVFEKRLNASRVSQKQLHEIGRKMKLFQVENERAYHELEALVIKHKKNLSHLPIPEKRLREIETNRHWRAILSQSKIDMGVAQGEPLDFPVPAELHDKIAKSLHKKMHRSADKSGDKATIKDIEKQIEVFINGLRCLFSPSEFAGAFRGTLQFNEDDVVEISHDGGDIVLETKLKDVIIELYSAREKYLDDAETDDNGQVVFHDMEAGKYKIRLAGYRPLD